MAHGRPRRAPLRFRWPLRLYLADRRGLCRQHRDDPRPRRSGPAGRGRTMVDSRPVEGRRRAVSMGQLGLAALPPSAAHGRSALCQLLASRALHSGYFRHVAAEGRRAHQYQPGVSAPDPYLPANSAIAQGAPDHGGGGRGCRQAETIGALLHLDLRHHGRANAAADRDVPGARARPRRQSAAGDERLPSAVGTVPRHRDPVRMVRSGTASRRHRGSLRSPRGRPFLPDPPTARTRLFQRCHHRRSRTDLSRRPRSRRRHHRNHAFG